ncbi:MAG: hypothetical protein HUU06_10595, partial [Planctomycetaceae bacterium]|nr:hypothetical protein [Planctomycetaceae bacterium]
MRRLLRLPPAALLLLGAASLPAAPSLLAGDDGGAGPRALVKGIAGSFDVFDADADGRIAEEELPLGDLFTAIDADRDGFLLPAELKAWLDAGEKEGEGGMAPPAEETFLDRARRIVATDPRFNASARRAEFLRNFDRDPKDGRIQRAEHAGDDGDRVFRKFDRDRNGALDDRELLSLAREQVAELAKSRRRPDRANFLYLFDLDQDRKVTKEEYALLRGPASTFTAYDLEADGVVTDDEVRYPEVYHGMADLFVYFFGHGLELLRPGGRLSYISSNSWLQTAYAEPLRRYVRTCCTVKSLVDLGNNRTFAEAPDVCPSIFVIDQRPPAADHRMPSAVFARGETPTLDPATLEARRLEVTQLDQPDRGWQLTDDATRRLVDKLLSTGRPLGEVVGGRMYYGVKTGLNEAFIVDTATREALLAADAASAELLKPLVRGEDLRPWYQEDEGRWLIFARRGVEIDRYPALKAHLEQYRERLEPRPRDYTGKNWPGRKPGDYQWYELQDTVAYYDAFEQPKIFWPDICKIPRFSWDETGRYCNDKGSVIVGDPALLAQLMARTTWFAISFIAVNLGERAGLTRYQLKSQFVAPLPIADAPPAHAEALAAHAIDLTTLARERYALHQRVRHRVGSDLGVAGKALNQK